MEKAVISVSQYVDLLNQALKTATIEGFLVEGEVSDFRISQGKWVNFDLKDEQAECKVSCFMTVFQLGVPLEDGLKIQVAGYPKIFERFGKFSLNVTHVELVGDGAIRKAYELLKKKLAAEGLFDLGRKRALSKFPERIGLITSKEAAAYGDFLRILGNRWGGVTVLHAAVHVQGQHAVPQILEAFATFNALPDDQRPDVLVLTRGGGSLEDLHAFNDERVARAVFGSVVPVVVGVGHERDESLCDFVADVRAATPSNAAELVVPDRHAIAQYVAVARDHMLSRLQRHLDRRGQAIDDAVGALERFVLNRVRAVNGAVDNFRHTFDRFRLSVLATFDHVERRRLAIAQRFGYVLQTAHTALAAKERLLAALDPQHILARGYAIVRAKGRVVRAASSLAMGERISVQFVQGTSHAVVVQDGVQDKLL